MSHDLGDVELMLTTETLLFDTKALTGFCECSCHKAVKPFFIANVKQGRNRCRDIGVNGWSEKFPCNCFGFTSWSRVFCNRVLIPTYSGHVSKRLLVSACSPRITAGGDFVSTSSSPDCFLRIVQSLTSYTSCSKLSLERCKTSCHCGSAVQSGPR
jgi:hypothetical protein